MKYAGKEIHELEYDKWDGKARTMICWSSDDSPIVHEVVVGVYKVFWYTISGRRYHHCAELPYEKHALYKCSYTVCDKQYTDDLCHLDHLSDGEPIFRSLNHGDVFIDQRLTSVQLVDNSKPITRQMTHRDLANWCRNGGEILIGDTTVYSCWTYDLRDANVPYIAKNIKIRKVGEDTWHEPEITLKPEDTWFDYDRESYEHNSPQCIQSKLQYGKKYKCYRTNGTCVSLYYHGTPSGETSPVFSEHLNLVVSDDWYKISEFLRFELDE